MDDRLIGPGSTSGLEGDTGGERIVKDLEVWNWGDEASVGVCAVLWLVSEVLIGTAELDKGLDFCSVCRPVLDTPLGACRMLVCVD